MDERIKNLIDKIQSLEDELREVLYEQRTRDLFDISGKRIEFEEKIKATHKQMKIGLLKWLRYSRKRNVLSAPFIYALIFPMLLLDISLFFYQAICFRLYGLKRVKRSDYILIDRHKLDYLNIIEKLNCVYCGYGNGLLAYAREIASHTEMYWCPIKHAYKIRDVHKRYANFLDYGEAEDYHAKVHALRKKITP